jgi:hypothetical protein
MNECKRCMSLAVDLVYYVAHGEKEAAISVCEELLEVLKSYKRSC